MQNEAQFKRALRDALSQSVILWATIMRCDALPLPDVEGYEVAWEASIDDYHGAPLIHRWRQRVDSCQSYEELRRDLEVLCVGLESYSGIEAACRAALGKSVIVSPPMREIGTGGARQSLLEHFTKKRHQHPPLHERLTRAEAEAYCRKHELEAFAADLQAMRFIDEAPDVSAPPVAEKHEAVPTRPQSEAAPTDATGRPMQPIFGHILDTYELVQMPVEPYVSEPVAPQGTYWLEATHCRVKRKGSHYHARIRLVLYNRDLDPPFEAVYEQDRTLTYEQLQQEFRKLQVLLTHPTAVQPACNTAIRIVGYANCLPDDAPAWLDQDAGMN